MMSWSRWGYKILTFKVTIPYIYHVCVCVCEVPSDDVNIVPFSRALSKCLRLRDDGSDLPSQSSDSLSPAGPAPPVATTAALSGELSTG